MTDTQPRTQRFRGRSPPDRDEWEVSTVALRGTNQSGTTECAVTGTDVALTEHHYYITLRKPAPGPWTDYKYAHLIVADGALGELDQWLEASEE